MTTEETAPAANSTAPAANSTAPAANSTAPAATGRTSAALTDAAHRSAGSFELVLGPVLMALLGLVLDGVFGTRPLLTVLFTIWGALGAGVSIYYRYRHQYATVSADPHRDTAR